MTAFQCFSAPVRSLFAFAVVGLLATSGCGGGAEGDKFKGERGSVSGTITYKGAPVPAGSSVVFQAAVGYTAGGKTNEKGEYTLTYEGKSVMPAVAYTVQVSAPAGAPATIDPAKMGQPSAPAVAPIPVKYSSGATSGLEFTVKGGANKADFELKD